MIGAVCAVCGCATRFEFVTRTPYLDRRGIYAIHRCTACGHRFAVGDASPTLLQRIYATHFHDTGQQVARLGTAELAGESVRFPVVANAVRRARWLHDSGMAGRLLDVGAGRGYFVKAACRFFEAEGVDIVSSAVDYAGSIGAKVVTADFLADNYRPPVFDVITLWDVLASLPKPHDAVAKLRDLLRPGGHLVMTVPYVDALVARAAGRFWPLLIPPVNLDYYSRKSISLLLERHGFAIREMGCQGKSVSLQFLAVKLARTLRVYGVERYLTAVPASWKVHVNLGDILTVVATRQP